MKPGQPLVGFVAFLVAAWPVVRALMQTKMTPERYAHVTDIARVAVRGAEQLAEGLAPLFVNADGTPTPMGAQKLDFATSAVVDGAKRLGVKLSDDEALAIVHNALDEMRQVRQPAPAA